MRRKKVDKNPKRLRCDFCKRSSGELENLKKWNTTGYKMGGPVLCPKCSLEIEERNERFLRARKLENDCAFRIVEDMADKYKPFMKIDEARISEDIVYLVSKGEVVGMIDRASWELLPTLKNTEGEYRFE